MASWPYGPPLAVGERVGTVGGARAHERGCVELVEPLGPAQRLAVAGQAKLEQQGIGRLGAVAAPLVAPGDAGPVGGECRGPGWRAGASEHVLRLARLRVPDLHVAVAAARGREAPVGAHGRGEHDVVVMWLRSSFAAAQWRRPRRSAVRLSRVARRRMSTAATCRPG